MSTGTIILQGSFVASGNNERVVIRSDADWMSVWNYTVIAAATANFGAYFYWQRGMAANDGIINHFNAAGTEMVLTTAAAGPVGGFTLVDTSGNPLTAAVAITAATNATRPVCNTGNTAGLITGSIVRLYTMTGQQSLAGYDFEIDTVVANTSFRIRYAMANAPGAAATAGSYRIIRWDPIYYPRWRFIANITRAAAAVVTTTVTHGYTVGQVIRFNIPAQFGMIQLDGLAATITAVTASTLTININTAAFAAFAFPLPAAVRFTQATLAPVGEDTAAVLAVPVAALQDAVFNEAILAMDLAAGNTSPAGNANDVLYWTIGKSFRNTNE